MASNMGFDVNGKFNVTTPTVININTTGDNTIVAGVSGQTIRIWRIFFVVDAATTITFKNGSTSLTGAISLGQNGAFVLDLQGDPWFVTTGTNNFVISQSGTAQISGVCYSTQS